MPLASFRDIRIIVERDGRLHHYYITAAVQRRIQRVAVGAVGVALVVLSWTGVERFRANQLIAANDALYAELLHAATAEGSMSASELGSLSAADLAALLRERTGVLRGEVSAAADLLAASNGTWLTSLKRADVGVASGGDSTADGRGGESLTSSMLSDTTRGISNEMKRSRQLLATLRSLPERLPLEEDRATSSFGLRQHPVTFMRMLHAGLDLVSGGNQTVHATRAGRVIFAGRSGGYGNTVVIAHDGGVETRYAHLRSFTVARGDSVGEWQPIGVVGSTGLSTGPHLHYEIRLLGRVLDPQRVLELRAHVR
jgi:murein DD-endopeptidase MepM/ murein hydrolase activator NlpD